MRSYLFLSNKKCCIYAERGVSQTPNYRYTYEDDGYSDFAPDFYKIELDGNSLKIDGLGNINNVKQKIQKWKKYQE